MTLPLHSMDTGLSMRCLLHPVSIESWCSSVIIDLAIPHEILLVFLYLEPLVNNFLKLLFQTIPKSSVTISQ